MDRSCSGNRTQHFCVLRGISSPPRIILQKAGHWGALSSAFYREEELGRRQHQKAWCDAPLVKILLPERRGSNEPALSEPQGRGGGGGTPLDLQVPIPFQKRGSQSYGTPEIQNSQQACSWEIPPLIHSLPAKQDAGKTQQISLRLHCGPHSEPVSSSVSHNANTPLINLQGAMRTFQ